MTEKKSTVLRRDDLGIQIPLGLVKGSDPGPTLCVIAGVHGTEYVGMESALRLYRGLDPAEIKGEVRVVTVADAHSLYDWSMFGSRLDGKNLARAYPGNEQGSYTEVLAHMLVKEVVSGADYLVDLHGGELVEAMNPYVGCPEVGRDEIDGASVALAELFDLPYISISERKGGLGDLLGIPSVYAEVGGEGKCDERLVKMVLKGLSNIMKHLEMIEGAPERSTSPKVFIDKHWLTAEMAGLFYPRVRVDDWVFEDELIGEIRDYFGELVQRVKAPADSVVMNVNVGRAVKKDGFLAWVGVVRP